MKPEIIGLSIFSALMISSIALRAEQQKVSFSLSATPINQFRSNLDGGGNLSVSRYLFSAGAETRISETVQLGFSLRYDFEDYDFSGATVFPGNSPWDEVHRLGLGINARYRFARDWSLGVAPSVQFAHELDAGWSDGLSFGSAIYTAYHFSPTRMVGVGISVFRGIEESSVSPFPVISWQINDKLHLRPSPVGPMGLELAYTLDHGWNCALGAAYRSDRFRLNDEGFAPEGVGEVESLPVFGRVTKSFGPHFSLDLFAGALLQGKLRVEDNDGAEFRSEEHDPTPFAALSLTAEL